MKEPELVPYSNRIAVNVWRHWEWHDCLKFKPEEHACVYVRGRRGSLTKARYSGGRYMRLDGGLAMPAYWAYMPYREWVRK